MVLWHWRMSADERMRAMERYFMKRVLGLLCLMTMLAGCDHGERELKWKEDVLLQDGRVITLDRVAKYEGSRELTQKNYGLSWYAVDFEHPVTREKIHWESQVSVSTDEILRAKQEARDVPPQMIFMALMLNDNFIYLVADPDTLRHDLGCPDPRYFLFKWESGHWKRMKLEDIPYRKFAVNVLYDLDGERDAIKASQYHVKIEKTAKQTRMSWPWIIDLTSMSKQTFEKMNCRIIGRDWTDREGYSN